MSQSIHNDGDWKRVDTGEWVPKAEHEALKTELDNLRFALTDALVREDALEAENARLQENPKVGDCRVCGCSIWRKQEWIADAQGMAHPICLVTQERDALRAHGEEMYIAVLTRAANSETQIVALEAERDGDRQFIGNIMPHLTALSLKVAEIDPTLEISPDGTLINALKLLNALRAQVERLTAPVSDEEWKKWHKETRLTSRQSTDSLLAARASQKPTRWEEDSRLDTMARLQDQALSTSSRASQPQTYESALRAGMRQNYAQEADRAVDKMLDEKERI